MAELYKVLYQGQPATSAAVVYTVPAVTNSIIKLIRAVNTSASEVTITIFVNGNATANRISPALVLAPDGDPGSMYTDEGPVTLNAGDTIRAIASAGTSVTLTICGLEVT
jgi:hypothetical protein